MCTQLTSKDFCNSKKAPARLWCLEEAYVIPAGYPNVYPIMTKSFPPRINIQTDFMAVNSLMLKQTQSKSNTWRWGCLLWHALHYELWMMNHGESILVQFSLGLVTTKFIDTKSVSREPGGYKCKTAIWDIHNLCALDVVICKKLQRNFNGLEAERLRKIFEMVVWLFFFFFHPENHFCTKRKTESFLNLTNLAIEPVIIEKKGISSSYFNALLIWCLGSHKLHYMAQAVAGTDVQFSQQRRAISIDQCPSARNR